jgi:hypothetical protein
VVRSPVKAWDLFRLPNAHTGYGLHPASYAMRTADLLRGVKRPGREADLVRRLRISGGILAIGDMSRRCGREISPFAFQITKNFKWHVNMLSTQYVEAI